MKKSMLKKIVVALAFGALASGSALAAVTARLGHAMPDTHPQAIAMVKFAELAGKYTNSNVQIKTFSSATLGSDEKQLQAVQAGTQEFYIGTLAPFSTRVKEVQVWDLPFMFANTKEVYALLDGTSSKKISLTSWRPSSRRVGCTRIPGVFMSISRKLIPRCGFADGSVRARQKIQSACWPSVFHAFWPLTT